MAARTVTALSSLAVVAIACAGCTADPSATATPPEPVTLSVGTDDAPGVPAAEQISALAKEVQRSGEILLEPVWHAAGDAADWDQAIAEMVVDGELDLAVVPSRAWASLGVSTLDPLTTPFLIQSDEALDAVLSDENLMAPMLEGLTDIGVVGIAAMPEGLRRPFGYHGALLQPSDYAGGTVRTATAEVNGALYRALGASVTDDPPDYDKHLGTDSAYLLGPYGTATGNVVFYPKVNVLVANSDAWAALSEEARAAIAAAASATQDWVGENQPKDSTAAQTWCEGGGSIVAASAEQLASLKLAAQPVVDMIAAEGENADVIAGITSVIERVEAPDPVTACDAVGAESESDVSIAGTYRYEITEQVITSAGASAEEWCPEICGIYTWTLAPDGTWQFRHDASNGRVGSAHGTWSFDEEKLTIEDPGYQTRVMVVEPDADGNLTMTPSGDFPEISVLAETTTPWMKVE
ncbi:hypothetical protein ACLQ2Q_16000 [Microbacterium sp. DT81.1]|uniref:hypothetical protein n=1 Tax=Microbacterium sp. DT81.1 TaxID=3393413 RepID=UPI003CF01C75